jgi:hypothetical protein
MPTESGPADSPVRLPRELASRVPQGAWSHRWLLLVIAVGTFTAFFRLDAKGLWGDEIWTVTWSRQRPPLETFLHFTAPPDLPLNFVITELIATLGTSELVVRLPEALMAVATVGLVYWIGVRYLNRSMAVVASLLLAVAAYHVWYAQDVRPYGPMALYAILSLAAILWLIERPRPLAAALFVVATTAGIYNHLFGLFPLVSATAFLVAWTVVVITLASRRPGLPDRRHVGRVWLAFGISILAVVLLCLPLALPIEHYLVTGGGEAGGGTLAVGSFPLSWSFLVNLFGRFGFGVGWRFVPVALLCVLGLVSSYRWRWWMPLMGVVWLALPLMLLWVAQPHHQFEPRYLLFLQPVYLLFAGVGVVSLAASLAEGLRLVIARVGRLPSLHLRSLTTIVLAAGLIGLFVQPTIASYGIEKQQDWRTICRYLHANVQPGDLVTGDAYFFDALQICPIRVPGVSVALAGSYSTSELVATGRRVWFVYIPTPPLGSAFKASKFVLVPRADWEQPGMQDAKSYTDLPFNITETHADLYRLDPQPRSKVEFHDNPASASLGWPYHVTVTAAVPVSVYMAVLPTSAEHVLRVKYLDWPGRDLIVTLNSQVLTRIDTSQGDRAWNSISIPLPASATGTVLVEFEVGGGSPAYVSSVEIVDQ